MDFPSLVFLVSAGLFIWPPRFGRFSLLPWHTALCATLALLVSGHLAPSQALNTFYKLSPALLSILALMFLSWFVSASGLLEHCLHTLLKQDHLSAEFIFNATYVLTVFTSAILSNDLAILILTPAIIHYAKLHFPGNNKVAFALAMSVFTAAGVAPLPTSNPMNLLFVSQFEIDILKYAYYMLPLSIVVWAVSFIVLRMIFSKDLKVEASNMLQPEQRTATHKYLLLLILAQAVSYLFSSYLEVPIWSICVTGALVAYLISHKGLTLTDIPRQIDWQGLLFLGAIYLFAAGLDKSLVSRILESAYAQNSIFLTTAVSAIGSALINNHPMASLSLSALTQVGASDELVIAVLLGGDVGPRILLTGSLAGVLWAGILKREGVTISLRKFFLVGLCTAAPALLAALCVFKSMY